MKFAVVRDPMGEGTYINLRPSETGIEVDPTHVDHLVSEGLTCLMIDLHDHVVYGVRRYHSSPLQEILTPLERTSECCEAYFRKEVAPLVVLLCER